MRGGRTAVTAAETGVEPGPSAHLTRAIATGDSRAFGAFYELWFDRTFALARSMSRRDEAFCMDVTHDTMVRVARSMRPLGDEPAVRAWMAKTVMTTTVDRLRSEERRRRREERSAPTEDARIVDPAADAESGEQLQWLRTKLGELPEDERRLLLERFTGDKTLDAVGRALGMTGNAAHGRIRRILARLRDSAVEFWT